MNLTAQMIAEAVDGIDSWCTVRMYGPSGYAGRGMYGRRCTAVVFDNEGDIAAFGMSLAYVVSARADRGAMDNPGDDPLDVLDDSIASARGKADSIGDSTVLYWPHIPPLNA